MSERHVRVALSRRQFLGSLTDELCQGRLVLVLEGGYNLDATAASVSATVRVLLSRK